MYHLFFDVDLTLASHANDLQWMEAGWRDRAMANCGEPYINEACGYIHSPLFKMHHQQFFIKIKPLVFSYCKIYIVAAGYANDKDSLLEMIEYFYGQGIFSVERVYNRIDLIFYEGEKTDLIYDVIGEAQLATEQQKKRIVLIDDKVDFRFSAETFGFRTLNPTAEDYVEQLATLQKDIVALAQKP
ncbi:hypothetical protein [Pelagibaculum spongiae]|uniref:Uncharacterized protein n=1 Tax=Pelagibaculum spongiae TaxID=2080658 RepID=A0A2V1H162_9GAMM|nr:hypothetical protein [Pelagibaculum spongiae]PVZ71700.1 hypothetical protein DC094_01345 [Pelagibaculum spongiae]